MIGFVSYLLYVDSNVHNFRSNRIRSVPLHILILYFSSLYGE